jgi:hypothetical protein
LNGNTIFSTSQEEMLVKGRLLEFRSADQIEKNKLIYEEFEGSRFIFKDNFIILYRWVSVKSVKIGILLVYFEDTWLNETLIQDPDIKFKNITFINNQNIYLNKPELIKNDQLALLNPAQNRIEMIESSLTGDGGNKVNIRYRIFNAKLKNYPLNAVFLIDNQLFELDQTRRIILSALLIFTFYLLVLFLFVLKKSEYDKAKEKLSLFTTVLIEDLLNTQSREEFQKVQSTLESRKKAILKNLYIDFKKLKETDKKSLEDQIDLILTKLNDVFDKRFEKAGGGENIEKLEKLLERFLTTIAERGIPVNIQGQVTPVQAISSTVKKSIGSADDVEELEDAEEIEDADEIEEAGEVEEAESADEIEDAEDIEEAESADEAEDIEEADEVEDTGFAEDAQELSESDEISEGEEEPEILQKEKSSLIRAEQELDESMEALDVSTLDLDNIVPVGEVQEILPEIIEIGDDSSDLHQESFKFNQSEEEWDEEEEEEGETLSALDAFPEIGVSGTERDMNQPGSDDNEIIEDKFSQMPVVKIPLDTDLKDENQSSYMLKPNYRADLSAQPTETGEEELEEADDGIEEVFDDVIEDGIEDVETVEDAEIEEIETFEDEAETVDEVPKIPEDLYYTDGKEDELSQKIQSLEFTKSPLQLFLDQVYYNTQADNLALLINIIEKNQFLMTYQVGQNENTVSRINLDYNNHIIRHIFETERIAYVSDINKAKDLFHEGEFRSQLTGFQSLFIYPVKLFGKIRSLIILGFKGDAKDRLETLVTILEDNKDTLRRDIMRII